MRRAVAALAAVILAAGPMAGPVAAQDEDTGWVIERFEARLEVRPEGWVDVLEVIDVDFQGLQRHGIYRIIPVRYGVTDDASDVPEDLAPEDVWRRIHLDDIQVSSTAPDDVEVSRPSRFSGTEVQLRIGDPDVTVSGRQRYEITYRVRGALNTFPSHEELYWNVTGQWPVPIRAAEVTVVGPSLQRIACFQGTGGTTGLCDEERLEGGTGIAAVAGIVPGNGFTIVAAMAPGSVAVPPPQYDERWDFGRAMAGSPLAWPLFAVILALVVFLLARLFYREGRDRTTSGGETVDGRVVEQPRPLFRPRETPVRFRPPDDLRPAHLGLLVDERVDAVDISATLVHLAVRGHLVIEEERDKVLWMSKTDWKLRRTPNTEDALEDFESGLLDALFSTGDEVTVSELKGSFAEDYRKVEREIYADAVARGWFNRNPKSTRSKWLGIGIGVGIVGVGVTILLAIFTRFAVAGLPLFLAGDALLVAHRWMPHRTAKGSRLLDETLGFREFVRTAEAGRMEFAEEENIFLAYLPFAVVFGAVDKWAGAFAHLGTAATAAAGAWYVGAAGLPGDLRGLSAGLSDFASTVGSSLSTTPASSGSSGFSGGSSGGGFGGGGGGSW